MHIYLFIHTIKSPTSKRKLEKHLSSLTNILSFEVENNCCTYEIQTKIHKKELIQLLGSLVQKLSLNIDERVVLYDTNILSSLLERPSNNEKMILNGDVEIENRVEDIMIMIFKHIKMKMVLEEVRNKYFSSLIEKK